MLLNKYSLIVPVYNNVEGLRKLLYSIDFYRYKTVLRELIIVNDGANNKISNLLSEFDFNIKEIKNKISKGSYYARNLGAKLATSENLIFADSDVFFEKFWLDEVQKYINNAEYIAFNVKIKKYGKNSFCEKFFIKTEFNTKKLFDKYKSGVTAFLVIKKNVFWELGGFDTELFSGGDTEFGNRVFLNKKKQYYCSKIIVNHSKITAKQFFRKKIRIQKGRYDLYIKYPNRFPEFNINFISFYKDFKSLISAIFNYKKYELSFGKNLICQCFNFFVFFCAKILVIIYKNKKFNY